MKDNTITTRSSEEDEENIRKAAENLSVLTDEKPSASKAIRADVKILAEQDPKKPELFYVNRKALHDLDIHLDYARAHLQQIYDEYLKTIGTSLTMEEIESWFGKNRSDFLVVKGGLINEDTLHKMYLEQKAKYPGLQFTYDNVILPDLEPLFEVCGQLIFVPGIEMREMFFWTCYRIISDKVELIPEEIETIKNRWRVYAVSVDEKARLASIRKLCDQMNTIKLFNPSQMNIPGFLVYDYEAGVYTPMGEYIKGYIK